MPASELGECTIVEKHAAGAKFCAAPRGGAEGGVGRCPCSTVSPNPSPREAFAADRLG